MGWSTGCKSCSVLRHSNWFHWSYLTPTTWFSFVTCSHGIMSLELRTIYQRVWGKHYSFLFCFILIKSSNIRREPPSNWNDTDIEYFSLMNMFVCLEVLEQISLCLKQVKFLDHLTFRQTQICPCYIKVQLVLKQFQCYCLKLTTIFSSFTPTYILFIMNEDNCCSSCDHVVIVCEYQRLECAASSHLHVGISTEHVGQSIGYQEGVEFLFIQMQEDVSNLLHHFCVRFDTEARLASEQEEEVLSDNVRCCRAISTTLLLRHGCCGFLILLEWNWLQR